jgi:hypothetical protein
MRKAVASLLVLLFFACPADELYAADEGDLGEPFGLNKSLAPDSSTTWQEWKKVIADADTELHKLERCRAQRDCSWPRKNTAPS